MKGTFHTERPLSHPISPTILTLFESFSFTFTLLPLSTSFTFCLLPFDLSLFVFIPLSFPRLPSFHLPSHIFPSPSILFLPSSFHFVFIPLSFPFYSPPLHLHASFISLLSLSTFFFSPFPSLLFLFPLPSLPSCSSSSQILLSPQPTYPNHKIAI